MSTRVSMLKRSIRPRTMLLIRGCVTPNSLAASTWVRLRSSMSLRTAIMRVERIRRCSASASSKPRSLKTLPLDGVIFASMGKATSGVADLLSAGFSRHPDTSLGQAQGPLGGLLCLLQKGVQDVDSFFELRQVEDSMLRA